MYSDSIGAVGETKTVSTSVVTLTAATYVHGRSAYLQVVAGGPIRWYADGRTPTSTTGFYMAEGGWVELRSKYELTNFKAIRDTAGADATLEIMVRK